MNNIDKITRDARILVNSAKDTVDSNLVNAVANNKLSINENQLREVLNVIGASFDEGYQKAIGVFQNTIKKHLT